MARVLGVDACRKGWVGIAYDGTHCVAYFGVSITDVVATGEVDGSFEVVAIDIPIGLPDSTSRRADELAWRELGPRPPLPQRGGAIPAEHTGAVQRRDNVRHLDVAQQGVAG